MNDGSHDGRIEFEVDGETLTVRDVIEGSEMRFNVDREPSLSPALPELFAFPVDRAISFEAESISVGEYSHINLRDDDGEFIVRPNEPIEFARGSYCVEITGTTKAYVRLKDAEISVSGTRSSDPTELSFDRPHTVTIGARSLHTRPEATITVPDDPSALAEAVSVLSSSIREFSPERSWPTLRGYPPRIERGDTLDIPSPLVTPDTGIEVIVRPTYADIYRLSTLSFYLGARMRIGDAPAIRLDNGYEERLPVEDTALEARVEELSRTWFFLDTLARMEGYTPSNRYEYESVGSDLPFYPPKLADLSMSERLMEYLEVDPETVAPYAPAWPTKATLRPTPAAAELLPHLARVLSPVRVRGAESTRSDAAVGLATSGWTSETESDLDPEADPISAGASVLTPVAYENRLRRGLSDRGEVSVTFLLNDDERAEKIRHSLTTPALPDGISSWSVDASPTRNAVVETLSDPSLDIVFCDLPARNGVVDASDRLAEVQGGPVGSDLSAPAVSVFEGTEDTAAALDSVNRGGVGGVAFDDIIGADRVRPFVGLLAAGFPVVVAAQLALDSASPTARFVGDPGMAVATDRGLPAQVYSCYPTATDSYQVQFRSFLSTEALPGRDYQMVVEPLDSTPFLAGTGRNLGNVNSSDIVGFHEQKDFILYLSGEFFFGNDPLTTEDIEGSARNGLEAENLPNTEFE